MKKNIKHITVGDLSFPVVDDALQERRTEVLQLCRQLLPKKWLLGDYKELVQLVVLYLDGGNREEHEEVQFYRPGAVHKARFMAKLIHAYKIVLLSDKIQSDFIRGSVFGSQQLARIKRFVQIVTFCYVPWWLTCPLAADAPSNDLLLLQRLREYAAVDAQVAKAATGAFERHLWYLNGEMLPLCCFSENVDDELKDSIASSMLKYLSAEGPGYVRTEGDGFGKPSMPEVDDASDLTLTAFVGPGCSLFFKALNIDHSFLESPASEWGDLSSYVHGKSVINSLSVVNDAAERGVRLASDFLATAKKEEAYQNILQVVENDRHMLPNQRSLKIEPKNWYLAL